MDLSDLVNISKWVAAMDLSDLVNISKWVAAVNYQNGILRSVLSRLRAGTCGA